MGRAQQAHTGREPRLERAELTASIARALESGSVVLTAGAGYGKTTAIELALEELGRPATRVSCKPESRDAGRLLTDLIGALQLLRPGLVDVIAEQLATAMGPVDVPATTAALLTELEHLLLDPVVVFLDDAEALAGAADALALVRALMSAPGQRLQVAVASRRALGLSDAPLRVAGRLAELGERELAFSPIECADYLRRRHGGAPDPDEIDAVYAATRGWPLGVAVSARGVAPGPGSDALHELFGFLGDEVLDTLEEPLRCAVVDSSAVRELDPEIERALGLPDDFYARIRALGLFAEPIGGNGARWRYHPLLREFLLTRLRAERTPQEIAALCARAADAEQAAGRPAEAVRLLLEGGRHEQAAELIAAIGQPLMRTSWRTVRGWLDALPAAMRAVPPLQLLEAQVLLAEGDQPQADELLRLAAEGFHAEGSVPGEWMARWFRASARHEVSDWEGVGEMAEEFDASVVEQAGLPAIALGLYGAAAKASRGDIAGARERAEHVMAQTGAELAASLYAQTRAYIEVPGGGMDMILAEAMQHVGTLEREDPFGTLPLLLGTVALVYYEIGKDADALRYWQRSAGEVERLGAHRATVVLARLQCAILLARLGRVTEAEAALAGARPSPAGFRESWAAQARAAIAWQRGEAAVALAECERAYDLMRGVWTTADRSWLMLTIVPILADIGELGRAREYVDDTLAFWEAILPGEYGNAWHARALAQRAWLRHGQGEADAAVDDLLRAWEEVRGTEAHLLRTQWPRILPVLWDALHGDRLDPQAAMAALRTVQASGEAVVPFLDHPVPEVRRAAIGPSAASGHPRAIARLKAMATRRGAAGEQEAGVTAAATSALERLRSHPPPLTFGLLGGFAVRRGEWEVEPGSWGRPVAAGLARFLLVHRGQAVPEDDLFAAFWPGRSPKTARSSLQVALSQARAVLDIPGVDRSSIVSAQRTYRLRLGERDRVDADEFVAAADSALAARGPGRADALERAAALWSGEPLPEDRYAPWTRAWRDDLTDRYSGVLAALVRAHLRAGDNLAAVAAARKRVALDPVDEHANTDLMVAYARAGKRSHALRQYLACRRALVDELGLEPSVETTRLHGRLLAGEAV